MVTRVLIAHEQALLADALKTLLSGGVKVEVIGVVRSARHATEVVAQARPDVLVAGMLPDAQAADLVGVCKAAGDGTAVLMVADDHTAPELFRAMDAGVAGFITTACSAEQLRDAVERVANGEVVVLGVDGRRMLRGPAPAADVSPEQEANLTPREREILLGICAGKSNRQIAEELFISQHTVRTHVQNIRGKLKVNSKLEAALFVVGAAARESASRTLPFERSRRPIRPPLLETAAAGNA